MGAGATVTGGSCIGMGAGVGVRSAVLLPGLIRPGAEAAGSSVKLTRRTTMGTLVRPAAVGPATLACRFNESGVWLGSRSKPVEGHLGTWPGFYRKWACCKTWALGKKWAQGRLEECVLKRVLKGSGLPWNLCPAPLWPRLASPSPPASYQAAATAKGKQRKSGDRFTRVPECTRVFSSKGFTCIWMH